MNRIRQTVAIDTEIMQRSRLHADGSLIFGQSPGESSKIPNTKSKTDQESQNEKKIVWFGKEFIDSDSQSLYSVDEHSQVHLFSVPQEKRINNPSLEKTVFLGWDIGLGLYTTVLRKAMNDRAVSRTVSWNASPRN